MVEGGGVGIVGGGIVGTSVAFFLRALGYKPPVTVYEPEPDYERSSTFRSAAALRQQFNLPVNIAMSRFGAEFYSDLDAIVPIALEEVPYLTLAAESDGEALRTAHARQVELGVDVELLDRDALRRRFPWLAVDDLAAGTLGGSGEGWLDPRAALLALRERAISSGVDFVERQAIGMTMTEGSVSSIELDDGERVAHDWVVDAAGRHAAQIARMAEIDIPVEARKRTAFVFAPASDVPQVVQIVDRTLGERGLYLRPYGTGFMAVTSPAEPDDPEDFGFEPQRELFDEILRPALRRRVPAFGQIELRDSWAGHYEMNTFDQNAIIGRHPRVANFVFVCGFSGHGVMHAPAAARGIAELITIGAYRTIDLEPFSFERIARGEGLDDVQPSEARST